MSKIYTEILDKKRKAIWTKLKNLSFAGTLGGGTALALQLKHRLSYDFDIFSTKSIQKNLLIKVSQVFANDLTQTLVDNSDELTVNVGGVKITFLYYPFSQLFPSIKTNSMDIFDIKDLIADKAYTIGRRGAWRDYYDIYWVLNSKITNLSDIILLASNKFGGAFNAKLFLEQLTYFDDIKDFSIETLDCKPTNPDKIKHFLESQVKEYLYNIYQQHD